MTIHRKLTLNEIKMINELLDGQLEARIAKAAFAKIEHDAALKAAYDELRWTKSVLRQMPRRKVPHNFVLTRQMAAEAHQRKFYRPTLTNLAGVVASLLFVVLLAIQMGPAILMRSIPMDMNAADEVAMFEQEADMATSDDTMMFESAEAVEEEAAPQLYETTEEEAVQEEMAEEVTEEDMAMEMEPVATISPYEASGGGALEESEEQTAESMPTATPMFEGGVGGGGGEAPTEEADTADETVIEEQATERIPVPETDGDEGMTVALAPEMEESMADEAQMEELPQPMMKEAGEEEVQPQVRTPINGLFIATVLAGTLAFLFIILSIRDRKRN